MNRQRPCANRYKSELILIAKYFLAMSIVCHCHWSSQKKKKFGNKNYFARISIPKVSTAYERAEQQDRDHFRTYIAANDSDEIL